MGDIVISTLRSKDLVLGMILLFLYSQIDQMDADLHSANKGTLPRVTIQINGPPGFKHRIPITGAKNPSLFITIRLLEESLCNKCCLYKFISVFRFTQFRGSFLC